VKHGLKLLVIASVALGGASTADNPFIGEWKLDPSKTRMPDEMKIESKGGNTFSFNFGGAVETIVVNGTDQPGYGGTMLSVKASGPNTWIVERKKDGRLQLRATWKLSKDGGTLADFFRGFEPDGSTLSMDYIYKRIGSGSGIAADWQSIRETMNSPFTLEVKSFRGDGLSFISSLAHTTKNAEFDGKDYPDQGPYPGLTSSIRRVDDHTLEMTDKVGGKVMDMQEVGVSPDGKSLTMTIHVPGQSRDAVRVFERE